MANLAWFRAENDITVLMRVTAPWFPGSIRLTPCPGNKTMTKPMTES